MGPSNRHRLISLPQGWGEERRRVRGFTPPMHPHPRACLPFLTPAGKAICQLSVLISFFLGTDLPQGAAQGPALWISEPGPLRLFGIRGYLPSPYLVVYFIVTHIFCGFTNSKVKWCHMNEIGTRKAHPDIYLLESSPHGVKFAGEVVVVAGCLTCVLAQMQAATIPVLSHGVCEAKLPQWTVTTK